MISDKKIRDLREKEIQTLQEFYKDGYSRDLLTYVQGKIDMCSKLLGDTFMDYPKNRREIWK